VSYQRHAKSTDQNQADIVALLRSVPGCSVEIIGRPVDLLVGYKGHTILIEVKLPKGPKGGDPSVLTDDQVRFFNSWRGGLLQVVRSGNEALLALEQVIASHRAS
jgi:hypothetical protein